jgi:hypothetical protein
MRAGLEIAQFGTEESIKRRYGEAKFRDVVRTRLTSRQIHTIINLHLSERVFMHVFFPMDAQRWGWRRFHRETCAVT